MAASRTLEIPVLPTDPATGVSGSTMSSRPKARAEVPELPPGPASSFRQTFLVEFPSPLQREGLELIGQGLHQVWAIARARDAAASVEAQVSRLRAVALDVDWLGTYLEEMALELGFSPGNPLALGLDVRDRASDLLGIARKVAQAAALLEMSQRAARQGPS